MKKKNDISTEPICLLDSDLDLMDNIIADFLTSLYHLHYQNQKIFPKKGFYFLLDEKRYEEKLLIYLLPLIQDVGAFPKIQIYTNFKTLLNLKFKYKKNLGKIHIGSCPSKIRHNCEEINQYWNFSISKFSDKLKEKVETTHFENLVIENKVSEVSKYIIKTYYTFGKE